MGGIDANKIYNELVEIREEINNLKSRIEYIEHKADIYWHAQQKSSTKELTKETIPETVAKIQKKEIGLEENIGKKWFSRIGIISIFIGMTFFIKYIFERNLMGPVGKISIGIIVGLILLLAGEYSTKKKYEYLSRTLTGGGFAVLYLSVYSAHSLYNLIPKELEIILLGLIVIFAVLFSLRYNSMVIASEAFFLGYVISFISSISEYTLIYATLLTIGLVIVVQRKGWINIGVGGLIAIYLTHFSWLIGHNSQKDFLTNAFFLSIYFIIFMVLAYTIRKQTPGETASLEGFQSIFQKIPESYHGILIASLNALFYYGLFYWIINTNYEIYDGLFTIIMAGVYLVLAYAALNKNIKELFSIFMTLCTTFITLAIPVQLNYEWVTFFWAIEGLILLVMGFRYNAHGLRVFGNIVGVITILKTLFIDIGLKAFDVHNIFESTRFFAFLLPIIAFYASSVMYFNNKDKTESEREFWQYYLVGGVLLTTVLLMLELKGGLISAVWTIQAIIILIVGFKYGLSFVRKVGIGLFLITIFKVFIFDLSGLDTLYRIMSFLVLGAILLLASFVYSKYKDRL
jgi:uncharacterized membrane protein